MAFIGSKGAVTSIPCNGEKICVGCDHWKGQREISYNGIGATSIDNSRAYCIIKKDNTYPNQPCTCCPSQFKKWEYLK